MTLMVQFFKNYMKLAHFTQGRDNNFNLIRFIASLSVLVTHGFALALGTPDAEPFRKSIGMTIGEISVDVFFITSGFLVTASLLYRKNVVEFIWARFLRIFPALLAMLLLTVLVIGSVFTTLSLSNYLTHKDTFKYLAKCSTLFFGVEYRLPGVFNQKAINGSLWTMPYEVRMYAILVISWLMIGFFNVRKLKLFKACILIFAVGGAAYLLWNHFYSEQPDNTTRLFFMFFSGASFFVLKESIVLSKPLFTMLLACLALATIHIQLFFMVYTLSIAYLLFYLAYVPAGFIRNYNLIGDYSYGIYIYAFPVQQLVAYLIPGVSVTKMIFISFSITITFAVLSWHLLEEKALGMKEHFIKKSNDLIRYRFKSDS